MLSGLEILLRYPVVLRMLVQSNRRIETPTDSASFWVQVQTATHNLLSSSLVCCFNEYSLPTLSYLFPSITVSKLCAKNKINWGGSNYVRSSGRSPQEDWPRAERIRERGRNATSSTFNIYLSILVFPGYCLLVFLFQFEH